MSSSSLLIVQVLECRNEPLLELHPSCIKIAPTYMFCWQFCFIGLKFPFHLRLLTSSHYHLFGSLLVLAIVIVIVLAVAWNLKGKHTTIVNEQDDRLITLPKTNWVHFPCLHEIWGISPQAKIYLPQNRQKKELWCKIAPRSPLKVLLVLLFRRYKEQNPINLLIANYLYFLKMRMKNLEIW